MRHLRTVLKEYRVNRSGLATSGIFLTLVKLMHEFHLCKKPHIQTEYGNSFGVGSDVTSAAQCCFHIPELPLVLLCNVPKVTT